MENQPLSQSTDIAKQNESFEDSLADLEVSNQQSPIPVRRWFLTFMCMNIPIIGWIYLIVLACSRSKGARRDFAKAYLIYKLVFLILSAIILGVAIHYGLKVLDMVLAYMEML